MDKKKLNTTLSSSNGGKSNKMPSNITKTPKPTAHQMPTSNSSPKSTDASYDTEGFTILWLDNNLDINSQGFRQTASQLQSMVKFIHIFDRSDQCIGSLNQMKKGKIVMLTTGSLSEQILPRIHNLSQLASVFVLSDGQSKYEQLKGKWSKVRGIYTDLSILLESLKQEIRQNDDEIDISFFTSNDISNKDLDQLDKSLMYTLLIKDIFLELDYNESSLKRLVTYCREKHAKEPKELEKIRKFEHEYPTSNFNAIQWYSADSFLYRMVNEALREQEIDACMLLAFYIRDLHQEIERLHSHQKATFSNPLTVYRGLTLTQHQFEKFQKTKGGLVSFNSFSSTSLDESIGLKFATPKDSSKVGILFTITVNPSISSAVPFASIKHISDFEKESEILFSLPTVFLIGEVRQRRNNNRLWDVALSSTSNRDPQLNALIERMRTEIEGPSPSYRLGVLMIKLGKFEKAEEVFIGLLNSTSDELQRSHISYQLGQINDKKQEYNKALRFYQDALNIYTKKLSANHPNIASCLNNIGLVYDNDGHYQEALSYYEKALRIYKETLSEDDPMVGTCCSSIGLIHNNLGDYTKAHTYCKQALDILSDKLPSFHPLLATSHNNLGLVYANMKKYTEAYSSHKRALDIGKQVLLPGHPSLEIYQQNFDAIQKKATK